MCEICQEIIDRIEKEFGHKVNIQDLVKLIEESPLKRTCEQCGRMEEPRECYMFATLHLLHQDMSFYDINFCTKGCLEAWLKKTYRKKEAGTKA